MAAAHAYPSLYVKSFFADSVEETLDRARIELGPDALLLNEREAPPESRHLGAFEVVFGVNPTPASGIPPNPGLAMVNLGERVRELREIVGQQRASAEATARSRTPIWDELVKGGMDGELAADIVATVRQRLRVRSVTQIGRSQQQWSAADVTREIAAELRSRLTVAPEIGSRCALIGPPGAGKTTTLVKLAVSRGLAAGRRVCLVSLDDRRIGAAGQLQAYAAILDVPWRLAYELDTLQEVIDGTPSDTLLLIDTPGQTALSMEDSGAPLAKFLRRRQDIDTHLVLTASTRETDLRRAVDRFAAFTPDKLLFTRLDETEDTGSMISEAIRTVKPISFLSTGQLVPEDLQAASADRLVEPLARRLPQGSQETI
jgi:flagellar biosynthesis protein FlhF